MPKSVRDAFSNNIFSIPNYQRDYAWGEKNLEDLWEDLLEAEQATNDTMGHFLGTIVVAPNVKNAQIYDIIDGQQRTTTIFMLRYALNSKTENPSFNQNYFITPDKKFKLQVIDDNKEFFEKILKQADEGRLNSDLEKEAKTQGQKRLYEVFKSIWTYVNSLDKDRASKLFNVLDNMALMWLQEQDSGRAIRMFQTVNDRGMPLLILDKLKSLLILYSNKYCQRALDDKINERFGEIFKTLVEIKNHRVAPSLADRDFQKEIEARLFNYHSLSQKEIGHYSYGADESYKKLKDLLKGKVKELSNGEKVQEFRQWLDDYSKDLLEFCKAFLEILKSTEHNVEAFKILMILRINPYFYASLVRLKMNDILDDECLSLFAQAEICFYALGSVNDSKAYWLYEWTHSKDIFKEKIIQFCKECSKGGYRDIQQALDEISMDNYEWGKYFHYMFFTYRHDMQIKDFWNLIDEKQKTYALTIEHIVPQNAAENGSLEQYGFKDEFEFNGIKNSFGNLLPLESALNSKSKDYGLAKKQENYRKSKVFYDVEFANSQNFLSFGKEAIQKENKKFTEFAKEFFKEFL